MMVIKRVQILRNKRVLYDCVSRQDGPSGPRYRLRDTIIPDVSQPILGMLRKYEASLDKGFLPRISHSDFLAVFNKS